MYMVKGCSRTEHEQLMGTLKIRSGTARKVKRKLPEKSNNKVLKEEKN